MSDMHRHHRYGGFKHAAAVGLAAKYRGGYGNICTAAAVFNFFCTDAAYVDDGVLASAWAGKECDIDG